jgi:hypothetical protein
MEVPFAKRRVGNIRPRRESTVNRPQTTKMIIAAGAVAFGVGSFGPFAGVAAADDDGSRNLPASSYPADPSWPAPPAWASFPADATYPAPPDWGSWHYGISTSRAGDYA